MGLIAGADVFINNMSPEAASGSGIDAETLRAEYPDLIGCAISGYGPDGPRGDDKAYDLAIQTEAGAFSVTGDEVLSKVGFAVADISAGYAPHDHQSASDFRIRRSHESHAAPGCNSCELSNTACSARGLM